MKGQTNRHRVAAVLRHVDFVVAYWPDLLEARIPGTRRRWAQTRTRAESRQHASMHHDEVAALTRAPAPVHLDVLDTIVDVVKISHTLADAVAQLAGVDRLPPPSSAYADPRPYLDLVKRHFDAAAEADGGWIVDAALDPHDDCSIVRARNRTASALRLVLSGQVLDADCPWCGNRPLRLEEHAGEWLVVCRSRRVCEPPETDCGTWVKDRPAWPPEEWEWLARRINHTREAKLA